MAKRRSATLELAILGALRHGPLHGYELRRELSATLGTFRALSFGSLYPALRNLTDRGLIAASDSASGGSGRNRIVYTITEAGTAHLSDIVAESDSAAWADSGFDVHFALFAETDPTTRLRILEGRRSRLVERLETLRESMGRTTRRLDAYTEELARHGLDQVAHEIQWLESVIDTERGTPGAFNYDTPQSSPDQDSPGSPASHDNKEIR